MIPTATRPGAPAATVDRTRGELRPDIQALRALAVVSVLLYHLWPNRLTGGYVGVDVFFVISGFLITSHLLREVTKTGRIRIAAFWARRAKRLLPASLLTLLATAIAVVAFVPEAMWRQFLIEVSAAALYVENWVLGANSVDYHAAGNAASPVQHFWTLSVEEQFYFALPLLLVIALFAWRGRPESRTRVLAIVIGVSVAASLVYSVWLTATTPTVAYFSTFTRAWEFGAGALLAFVTLRASRLASIVLPIVGVALIAAACVVYDAETPFPGIAAALPVVGTLLVLWAGRDSVVARIGAFKPVALIGEISYAVYLWHWPLIVILPFVTLHPLTTWEKLGIIVATVAIAWLSTKLVEEPVRFSPKLLGGKRRPRTVAAWSALGMAIVVGFSMLNVVALDQRDQARYTALEQVQASAPDCFGAASMDPALAPCENPELEGMLLPDPSIAVEDDDNIPECWGMSGSRPKICTIADPPGATQRILAVGDSHNNTLIGAYREIAESQGWRMDVAGLGGCYLTGATQTAVSQGVREICGRWKTAVIDAIRADPPDAIIVTHSAGDNMVEPAAGETLEDATVAGLVDAWTQLPDVPIIAIRDNPGMTRDTMRCVSQNGLPEAVTACARPRAEALEHFDGNAEAVAQVPNARLVDLTDFYCTADSCSPVIGGVLVYRDARHVTATWAHTLAPYLGRELVDALNG